MNWRLFLSFSLLAPLSASAGEVAHYNFDEDYDDASGNLRHGSLVDQATSGNSSLDTTSADIPFGDGALSLSVDRDYIAAPEMILGESGDYTIAFFARREGPSTPLQIVAGNRGNTNDFIGIFTDGRGVRWRNSYNETKDIGWAPNDNDWHHYALVVTSNELTLYVDGSAGTPVSISNSRFSLNTIGDGYTSAGYDFEGRIDEFRVFDEALDATAISSLYDSNTAPEGEEPPPEEPVTRLLVILQGGQSNADGRAGEGDLPMSPVNLQAPQLDVDVYHQHENGSAATLTVLQPGLNRKSSQFGPEITMGRAYADLYAHEAGTRVAIIKYAVGGTHLAGDWVAGGDATTAGDGPEYQMFQTTVVDGLAALAAAYPEAAIEVQGMVWMQGESDANHDSWADRYEGNLRDFIDDVRQTFGADLPFIVGRLSVNQTVLDYEEIVQAAQDVVATEDPRTGIVNTDSLSLLGDNIHFDGDGQISLGRLFAEELAYYAWMRETFSEADINTGETGPESDLDSDGQSNRQEFMTGSDPEAGMSRFQFNFNITPPETVTLQLPSLLNRLYLIERYNETSMTWESISSAMVGNDDWLTYEATGFSGSAIYRVQIELP